MDYKHKYNKYKTKYLKLLERDSLEGGSKESRSKEPFCSAPELKKYLDKYMVTCLECGNTYVVNGKEIYK